jgi:predicted nucleic acid-binding protein
MRLTAHPAMTGVSFGEGLTDAYLLDTNVLVLAIQGRERGLGLLRELAGSGANLGCSVTTVGEIYAGMRQHEAERTTELLEQLDVYPVTLEIARHARTVKNEWRMKWYTLTLADTLIAATAIRHRMVLVTDNRKDFPMGELKIRDLA